MSKNTPAAGLENIHDAIDSISESIKSLTRASKCIPSHFDSIKSAIDSLYLEKKVIEKLEHDAKKVFV
jgi:hypothetical protein